jgi:hypothetical protein
VVDVTHDRDHGGPDLQVLVVLVVLELDVEAASSSRSSSSGETIWIL